MRWHGSVLGLALLASAGLAQDGPIDAAGGGQIPAGRSAPEPGLFELFGLPGPRLAERGVRVYGWADMGYTYASSGTGLLAVQPQMNRFGREYLLNQLAAVVERTPDADRFSTGYRVEMLGGADAADLQGPGDIHSDNPRVGGVVRQLYVAAHVPALTDGGVDLQLGRRGTPMGYESYRATQRPFYSLSYQWNYAEDGADTGLWSTWHATDRLDLIYGLTMGANTFFTFRGHAPDHLIQLDHWLQEARRTRLTGTVLIGNQAVGNVLPVKPGELDTVVELRAQQAWTSGFSQVVQANLGWDSGTPVIGLARWYGLMTIGVWKLTPRLDGQARLEWFDDVTGSRSGFPTNYYAVTAGVSHQLRPWLLLRPEVRGDLAGLPAFGPLNSPHRSDRQLTAALECLVKF